VAKRK
jgi:hypothetical protein